MFEIVLTRINSNHTVWPSLMPPNRSDNNFSCSSLCVIVLTSFLFALKLSFFALRTSDLGMRLQGCQRLQMRKKRTAMEWHYKDENIIIWCKNGFNALKLHIKSALFRQNMLDSHLLSLSLHCFH